MKRARYAFVASKYSDAANNYNNTSASHSVVIDTVRPTLAITDNKSGESNGTVTFSFSFSEAVLAFTEDDVNIGSGISSLGAFPTISSSLYTIDATILNNYVGDVGIAVVNGSFWDMAYNSNQDYTSYDLYYDSANYVAGVPETA